VTPRYLRRRKDRHMQPDISRMAREGSGTATMPITPWLANRLVSQDHKGLKETRSGRFSCAALNPVMRFQSSRSNTSCKAGV